MPEFKVFFERPVIYLPDHRLHRREVRELLVNAPDEAAARIHAIRVTTGDPGTMTVAPADVWAIQNEQLKLRRAPEEGVTLSEVEALRARIVALTAAIEAKSHA